MATGVLSGNNPASKLTKPDLKDIRSKFHIPCHVSLHALSSEVRADWNLLGMTCLYELPFKEGFRLPLLRFVTDVCDYYCVSPAQLMPNAWRVLLAIELFCEMNSIEFSRDEVLTAYKLKECHNDVGRYQLHSRFIRTPLIPRLKDCDKHWKDRYFFLPFDSLDLPSKCRVSRTWAAASCTSVSFESKSRELTAKRIREFLSHSEDSRWWEAILIDANLRGSSLWRLVPFCEEDYVMPHIGDIPLGGDDAIEIFKRHMAADPVVAKGKFAVAKRRVATAIPAPSVAQAKKKRAAIVDHSDWSTNDIRLSFPHSVSAYSDFGPQAAEVGKLLWPEDKDRFEDLGPANAIKNGIVHAFQGMQMLLYIGNKVDELCGQMKTLRAEKSALQVENKKLVSEKLEVDKLMAELRVQFNSQVSEVSRLQAEVESLNARVASKEKRVYMAAMKAEIKLKAKMIGQDDGRLLEREC